jgi:hypothetical protein
MSRLRRNELIPEDTGIHGVFSEPKIVHGRFGRQVEVQVRVLDGDYKNATFKDWFNFGSDKDTNEEYIRYGSPLYTALSMVADDLDTVLDDDDLSDREYEKLLKTSVKKLDGTEVVGRVGVKVGKNDPDKKRNFLQPGSFGPYVDIDKTIDEDMAGVDVGAPDAPDFD